MSEDVSKTSFQRLVEEARIEAQAAKDQYWESIATGQIDQRTQRLLARQALKYYDVLWEYKTKTQRCQQAWDKSSVDELQELANREVTVYEEMPGDTRSKKELRQPAITQVPARQLVQYIKELDDLASALGFSGPTTDERNFGRIGSDKHWSDESEDTIDVAEE